MDKNPRKRPAVPSLRQTNAKKLLTPKKLPKTSDLKTIDVMKSKAARHRVSENWLKDTYAKPRQLKNRTFCLASLLFFVRKLRFGAT